MNNSTDFYEWLNGFINFEKKPHTKAFCLDVIRYYAALFGQPQAAYKTAHIAGSKGKGSVAAMFSSLLTAAGWKTGLYTSPHVNDFRERITQNGSFFSDTAYLEAFRAVQDQVLPYIGQAEAPQPSWFELVTLTAFVLFRQEQLDWAVFETGMGGRLDATNIIQPAVVLLAPIELEHCEYLGNTIRLIAAEKAGIIKAGVPVFCSRQDEDALTVFKKRAAELNAPFFYLPDCLAALEQQVTAQGLEVTISFSAENLVGKLFHRSIHTILPLFTPVQAENAALAAAAFKYCYPEISENVIEQALAKAWLPARFQLMCRTPLIVIDGAHTHNSIQACADTFFQLTNTASPSVDNRRPILVFACAADKNPAMLAPVFSGQVSHVYLTVPGSFKKGNLDNTIDAFSHVFAGEPAVQIEADKDFRAVLQRAFLKSFAEKLPLLITGSFYLAAEAQYVYVSGGFQDRESSVL